MLILRKCHSVILFVIALLCFGVAPGANHFEAGEDPSRASEDLYERVMDLTFPREVLKDKKVRFAFVLRYQPTFQPESQIVIVRRQDGIEVTTYKSLDGNIETTLDAKIRQGTEMRAAQLARQFRIEKRSVTITAEVASKLHDDFFEALRFSERRQVEAAPESINVTADGTLYRLWYSGRSDIQCDLHGSNIRSTTDPDGPPLMEWMKSMSRRFLP